jgi:flavin-dependent dehydrogenase
MLTDSGSFDVTVVGGGLAGMAASIHLARTGLKVLCIEAKVEDSDPVGESLDWSAPELLRELGLPMEELLEGGTATCKRHVILKLRGGAEQDYVPSDWLAKPPFNVELRTIHADRTRLNLAVHEIFLGSGATLLADKVVRVVRDGNQVSALQTENGSEFISRWYVDASGSSACLFPRVFKLPSYEFGPPKVAIWDYFAVPESIEGTTLYADCEGPFYMSWVWQIPIHPNTVSVGYVAAGESIKEKRREGQTVQQIYDGQLGSFRGLRDLLQSPHTSAPRTTSFSCRAHGRVAGPNWLAIGESAAMVDPMTSNGVTAALRHAAEAARLITRYRNRKSLPWLPRTMYCRRVLDLANFFNAGIERVIYDWPIRNRIGALVAGDVYTIPAWSINNIYSRIQPNGVASTILFGLFLATLRVGMNLLYWFCKRSQPAAAVCATS